MKGTKLWQATGSPLISGRSREHRPYVAQWLGSWGWSEVLLAGALIALSVIGAGGRVEYTQAYGSWLWFAVVALPGTGIGSALGVVLARAIGWRRQRVAGIALGLICGAVSAWLLFAY